MRYAYELSSTVLKDLNHIEWFVHNVENYDIKSDDMEKCVERIKRNISKKNLYYSEIVEDYEYFTSHFSNNPYDYIYDVLSDANEKKAETYFANHYFVNIVDEYKHTYTVPMGYIESCGNNDYSKKAESNHKEDLESYKEEVQGEFNEISARYHNYWLNGGTRDAISRYAKKHNGKDYKFGKQFGFLFVFATAYFIFLFSALFGSTKLVSVIGALGIVMAIFFGYRLIFSASGLFYEYYINQKYNMVLKHHQQVLPLIKVFDADEHQLKAMKDLNSKLKKIGNREQYKRLVDKVSRVYNFKDKNNNLQDVVYSKKSYYSFPLSMEAIFMLVICVVYVMIN